METDPSGNHEFPNHHTFITLMHEIDMKESLLRKTKEEVEILQKEVENLRLEKEWCFNDEGKRIIPTAQQQALDICQQIMLDPDLRKDIVRALRIKKIDLQSNIKQLQENCDSLKGENIQLDEKSETTSKN